MAKTYHSFHDYLTQTGRKHWEVSQTLDVSPSTISRWASGSPMTTYAMKAISYDSLNQSINQFSQQLTAFSNTSFTGEQIAENLQKILEESCVEIQNPEDKQTSSG